MANKQILSVVAATILAASFTLTGCGSSSSSSSSSSTGVVSSGGSVSSSATLPVEVTVAQTLEATVKKAGVTATSNGYVYEFPAGTTGDTSTLGGAFDSAEPKGQATAADPKAPAMAAKGDTANVNAFTTMEAAGMTLAEINAKYNLNLTTTDVAVDGTDLDLYKANAKAALDLSATPPASSEAAVSSEAAMSSSASVSSAADCDPSLPCAAVLRGVSDIDDCTTTECVDAIVTTEMTALNGSFLPEASSEAAMSSEAAESSEAAVSSEASTSSEGECDPSLPC